MESNKFKSYNELLRVAKSLESDEEKIELICDYFINNVTYNYAYLEAIRIDRPETGIEDIVRDIDSRYNAYEIEERKLGRSELEQKMRENMKSRYKNSQLDLTNAIFIRDGYGDNPAKAKPQDWYMATTEAIYRMQPCRRIERIGDNKPKQEITSENFLEQMQFINDCSKGNINKDEQVL